MLHLKYLSKTDTIKSNGVVRTITMSGVDNARGKGRGQEEGSVDSKMGVDRKRRRGQEEGSMDREMGVDRERDVDRERGA